MCLLTTGKLRTSMMKKSKSHEGDDEPSFNDQLKDFIDNHYINACRTNNYFWVCNDFLQNPYTLTKPPYFSIPRKELTKMLRNSSNIIPVVMEARKDVMKWMSHDATMFPEVKPGHNIAGAPVIWHQLEDVLYRIVSSDDDELSFRVQMVRQEMNVLLKGELTFRPSDITILYDINHSDTEQQISDLLKQEFKLDMTTMKDHVKYGNNDKVVFGYGQDCMSHEAPCVIYIEDEGFIYNMYVLLSRARARLTIISTSKDSYLYDLLKQSEHVSHVKWVHEHDGNFVKVAPKESVNVLI